jgi:hypothetical protein
MSRQYSRTTRDQWVTINERFSKILHFHRTEETGKPIDASFHTKGSKEGLRRIAANRQAR